MPITSGRRAVRRIASASVADRPCVGSGTLSPSSGAILARDGDRGVKLTVLTQYPAPLAVPHDLLGSRLGRCAVLELDIDVVGIRTGQQLLLQGLPIGRVVDVIGDVALGGAEDPRLRPVGAL